MADDDFDERMRALRIDIESLHANAHEVWSIVHETARGLQELKQISRENGEHIRALVRIAEIHERRLTDLEGGEAQ
jgi:hypothetical protein